MSPSNHIQQIVFEYRERLRAMLGDELDAVVLYGSQARGDAKDGSDIDVLCVMKGPFDYSELLEKTSELTATVSLDYEVVISRGFVTRRDYHSRLTPFLMNVRKEGVIM